MFADRGQLIQYPANSIDIEDQLVDGVFEMFCTNDMFSVTHHHHVQNEQYNELNRFKDVSGPWHYETVLVQVRSSPRIVERYGTILVVIW